MATPEITWAAHGTYLSSDFLSEKLRQIADITCIFRDHVRLEPGFGKRKGDTIDITRYSNVASAGGIIGEDDDMPETGITTSRTTLTVQMRGNSIPWSLMAQVCSRWSPEQFARSALTRDHVKVIDLAVAAEFKSTYLKATPTGETTVTWDTDGTISNTATVNVNDYHLRKIALAMKESYLIPPHSDGYYHAICTPTFLDGIWHSQGFERAYEHYDPSELVGPKINAKERGTYQGIRFFEEINSGALTTKQGVMGEAVIFGDDAVVEGIAMPVEIRRGSSTLGIKETIGWLEISGWKETWPATVTAGEVRTVQVTSL